MRRRRLIPSKVREGMTWAWIQCAAICVVAALIGGAGLTAACLHLGEDLKR
jgi:hypothetical protein